MTVLLPVLVGYSTYGGASTDPNHPQPFTLAIPAGTQVGDLLVATLISMSAVTAPGRGLAELYKFQQAGYWSYGVWAGPWDGDTTPISWEGSGENSATGQFFGAILAAYRGGLDPARPMAYAPGPTVPGLPSEGPALCVSWYRTGIGDSPANYDPFGGTDWEWTTESVGVDASTVRGIIAMHGGAVANQTVTDPIGSVGWPYMTFGLYARTVAPPCRIYPREDSLGVGSGRIWPPPKSHQFSPRRAGGYY